MMPYRLTMAQEILLFIFVALFMSAFVGFFLAFCNLNRRYLMLVIEKRLMMEEERLNDLRARRLTNEEVSTVRVKATTTEGLVKQRASKFMMHHTETNRSHHQAPDRVDSSAQQPTNYLRNNENGIVRRPSSLDLESNTSVVTAVIETPPFHKEVNWERDKVQGNASAKPREEGLLVGEPGNASRLSAIVPRGTPARPKGPEEDTRGATTEEVEGRGDEGLQADPPKPTPSPAHQNKDISPSPPAYPTKDDFPKAFEPLEMDKKPEDESSCVVDCLYYTMQCCECTIL